MLKFKEFPWVYSAFGDAIYGKNTKQIEEFLVKEQEDNPDEILLFVDLKVIHKHSVILIYKLMPKAEYSVRSIMESLR